MKIYLYILLLLCTVTTKGQTFDGAYTLFHDHEDIRLRGDINSYEYYWKFSFKGNRYELSEYTKHGWDCAKDYTAVISYGFFIKNFDTFMLYDYHAGYNMKLAVTDSTLQVLKGFEAFKDALFTNKNVSKDIRLIYDENFLLEHPDVLKPWTRYLDYIFINEDTTTYTFQPGVYTIQYSSSKDGYRLIFTDDKYAFKVGDKLLTQGSWTRKENFLLLDDETTEVKCIVQIPDDNKLLPHIFPCQLLTGKYLSMYQP